MIKLSGDTWNQWEALHKSLLKQSRWKNKIAGLFQGHVGPGFSQAKKTILYTGKATRGTYDFGPADLGEECFGNRPGAFWSFAKKLSHLAGGAPDTLNNLAWSNLCKIGTRCGNPPYALVLAQQDLAAATLRQEWQELRPTLVVCVAEDYNEQLIRLALGVPEGRDGFSQTRRGENVYWVRKPIDGMPSFLWMKHPQGKKTEYLAGAEELARDLLG